jgi:hypothetical protein
MLTIGIYKPGKKIYFYENQEDHASWSAEVTNIAKIFVAHGNHVIILSQTDLINQEHLTTVIDRPIDRIYVFNGIGPSDDEFKGLKAYTNDIRLIITDLKLIPPLFGQFTHIYTQSKMLYEYGAIEQNTLFNAEPAIYPKSVQLYFGGTERNRLKEIIEYVWRPNTIWKGKSAYFGFNNYIPYHEHIEMLKKTKYTIVIGDEHYNKIGFVTPRFYECAKYNVIPFVSHTFDPNELIISKESFFRVKNYQEMLDKIKLLDENQDRYYAELRFLATICFDDKVKGHTIYNLLK